MTREFDRLITDAAPESRDCDADRRTTRTLLHDRMRKIEQRRRRWNWSGALVAGSLALFLLIVGPITELGSDSFDILFESEVHGDGATDGTAYRELKIGFGRGKVSTSTVLSDEDARELEIQAVIDEGIVTGITGLEIDGVVDWQLGVDHILDGKVATRYLGLREDIRKLPVFRGFMKKHLLEVFSAILSETPNGTFTRELAGHRFQVDYWKLEYPEYGTVTWYEGTPNP